MNGFELNLLVLIFVLLISDLFILEKVDEEIKEILKKLEAEKEGKEK